MKHGFIRMVFGVAALAAAGCTEDTTVADPRVAALTFNEMAGTGGDFAEVINTGSADVDVSGYGATDSNDDGSPRAASVVRFPAGTVVRAGGYLVVMFESNCPAGATYPCFRCEAGISQGSGENIHLVNAQNAAVRTVAYPANGAPSGRSLGRIPNGTGTFVSTVRTLGAANSP